MCPSTHTVWNLLFHTPRVCLSKFQEGIFLHTRSNGKLFNLAKLRTKTKVRTILIYELLFADDAALVSHNTDELQELINRFLHACKEFCEGTEYV